MPYFEGVREAWDERRLIETVKRAAKEKNADLTTFWARLFAEVAAERGQGGTSTLTDFWERAKDDEVMDRWHDRLVAKLLELRERPERAER